MSSTVIHEIEAPMRPTLTFDQILDRPRNLVDECRRLAAHAIPQSEYYHEEEITLA